MPLKDNLNILSKTTPRRVWNLMKLKISFLKAKKKGGSQVKGLPFAASIEPTTACNLGCPECPSGLKQFTRPTGKIDLTQHKIMLNSLGKQLMYINYYFQGEPFIHPQFLELIKEANSRKIYTSTSTNAHFISPDVAEKIVHSGLDRLIISIDGTTQETYEQYRVHGKLDKVLEGTRNIVTAKKKLKAGPHIIFQFLVVKPNEHQTDDVLELAKEMEVDEVRFKSAQLYDYEDGNPLMPENEKYSRYVKMSNGKYKPKYTLKDECWRMWSSTVLTWDGRVVPCCFDKDAKHVFGNVLEKNFSDIWRNRQYTAFRKSVFTERNQIDICKNCSEGAEVWV